MNTEQLYESMAGPATQLERFSVRRRRGLSLAELQSVSWGMIASFEEIVALGEPLSLEITVREVPDEQKVADEADEATELEAFEARMNTLLETLRRCRASFEGELSETLLRALKLRDPSLAAAYSEGLHKALARLAEIEKTLIMYGAGTDADDALVADVIPAADGPAGPSVAFEL